MLTVGVQNVRDEVKVIIVYYYVGLMTRLAPSADVHHDIDATYCAPRCYNIIPDFMHGVIVDTVGTSSELFPYTHWRRQEVSCKGTHQQVQFNQGDLPLYIARKCSSKIGSSTWYLHIKPTYRERKKKH